MNHLKSQTKPPDTQPNQIRAPSSLHAYHAHTSPSDPTRHPKRHDQTHHSVTFNRCSATMMRKFCCASCSCRVPVVLGGFVSRLRCPRPPVCDGAGVPWVLTGTHQRDAPSRQDDGVIRAPNLRGWCCQGSPPTPNTPTSTRPNHPITPHPTEQTKYTSPNPTPDPPPAQSHKL